MKTDYCTYPPQIAADVEIAEQRDGRRQSFIAGSASVGRYIILRETEYKVFNLIDGSRTLREVCEEFKSSYGAGLGLTTLVKFLNKLDQYGVLASERTQETAPPVQQLSQAVYLRFKLFNPDRLFSRLVPPLRWIWTTEFFVATIVLMIATLLVTLLRLDETVSYGGYLLREHFIAVFVAGWIVVVSHEFAHGMTCKAFGGRVTEVGVLLIYYCLPGMYCNVSGLHLIPQRNRRLWVIAAGIYWQLMVGSLALLSWFAFEPYTLPADLAFIFFLGSVLNIIFNTNPLIKLDGYYFLSQLLRLPNLMDRSRAYWRGLLKRAMFSESNQEAARYVRRERAIYFIFGLLSFVYNVGLKGFIVIFIGAYLVTSLHLAGLVIAVGVAVFYARVAIMRLVSALPLRSLRLCGETIMQSLLSKKSEADMSTNEQSTTTAEKPISRRPRYLVPAILAAMIIGGLMIPWRASVGNYGELIAVPAQEAIIRAPESATLVALNTQPGEKIASGAVLGRMGNFDLEEQIVQVQADLARVTADYDRLVGEIRAREELALRADLQLRQRQREYDEIDAERRQVERRRIAEAGEWKVQFVKASTANSPRGERSEHPAIAYPAALAVLQSEVDSCRAQLDEANAQRDRMRKLHGEGITPRSELDAAEMRAATLANALAAARQRLEAALIEHRRKYATTATEMNVANTDLSAERLQIAKLNGELNAMQALIGSLQARQDLLLRKRAQFELITPRAGTVFGEELQRSVGQYFQKGAEICRVADTQKLLLRIQVPEREIGDVRVGHPVRLKVRAYPDQVFRGVVSKIGGESDRDQNDQATYRVELTIENNDALLRPGMTAFARIDFDRRMIGGILAHKIKQALRPELWML
jgi:multidrug resistance efflux pump